MNPTDWLTEGDVNFAEERRNWTRSIEDAETVRILENDARFFLHQAMSTPCLDALERCKGSVLTTVSGKGLLDFHGNNVHQAGYGNDFVIDAIIEQMGKLPFSPRRYTNRPAVELARRLATLLPGDLNRSLFAPGGSEVVSMALKLARVVTGKHKVVSLNDSFHGATLDSIAAGGEEIFKKHMGPLMPGVFHIPAPVSYSENIADPELKQLQYADYLEEVINREGDIGAFLAETIRNTDVQIPTTNYWQRIRQICDKYGVVLIIDEIPIALGRTGKMFAFEHFGFEPDILCLGKGLGGGIIPFAAMVARDTYNVAADISIGHFTHEKSPLGSVAALATIDFLESGNYLNKATEDGIWLKSELLKLKDRFPLIGDVRGLGLLWGVELVKDPVTREKASDKTEKIMYECMRNGLNFKVSQGNVIQLSPALTISRNELKQALVILSEALEKYS